MVRRMVRFFLRGQCKRLSAEGQTHQQEEKQRPASAKPSDTMVGLSYALRLPGMPRQGLELYFLHRGAGNSARSRLSAGSGRLKKAAAAKIGRPTLQEAHS